MCVARNLPQDPCVLVQCSAIGLSQWILRFGVVCLAALALLGFQDAVPTVPSYLSSPFPSINIVNLPVCSTLKSQGERDWLCPSGKGGHSYERPFPGAGVSRF